MLRPIFEGSVRRLTLAKIVAGQFFLFLILLGAGLQLVKYQLQNDAASLAVKVNNQTTCAFRQLVDTPIAGYRRTIKIQQAIVDDKSRNKKVRIEAAHNVKATEKTLDGLLKFRNVYITVPADYKCPASRHVITSDK